MIGGLEEQPCNTGTILQASANKILASTILAHCYNLGGREVIAEEFPMASPHAYVVMEKCHKSYLQPSKGDDQFERSQCITDDGRRNGTTCTTVTSKELMSR